MVSLKEKKNMKIRLGFVSNSSSSSYTCDFTGEEVSGMDLCLSDIDWIECTNGHVLSDDSLLLDEVTFEGKKKYLLEEAEKRKKYSWNAETAAKILNNFEGMDEDEIEDIYNDWTEGMVPSSICPFCQMKYISERDMIRYLIKKYGYENIVEEIKGKFSNYSEFSSYLGDVRIHPNSYNKKGE